MESKLFIFDLDGTILKFNIGSEQFSNTKIKINTYFKKYNIQNNLRPLIPKIIFLSKIATNDRKLQAKIIKDCFSIIDEMEIDPDGGIEVNQKNIDLLINLEERNIKIGIISNNGKKGILNAINKARLREDFFTFLVTRDDVCLPKPFIEPYLKIANYLSKYNCYLFSDNILDFLPLIYLEKIYGWNIKKCLVLQTDIKNQSYNWVTMDKIDFNVFLK